MKLNRVMVLSIATFFAAGNANAKQEQDVNVVNTPTVNVGNSVTIDNADVPATIKNGPANPVPVISVARQPYEFFYALSAQPGSVESCVAIPVPEGEVLTIATVGVDAQIDPAMNPDVSLRVDYENQSVRYSGALNLIYSATVNSYQGIYNLSIPVGDAGDSSNPYHADICLSAPDGGSSVFNEARGTVSGFVEANTVIDGNSLP